MRKSELRKAFTIMELLVVVAVASVLLAIMVPMVSSIRESGRRVHCHSNLRQLGVAFYSFAHENGDRFPRSDWNVQFGYWPTATWRYYRSFELLLCPSDSNPFSFDQLTYMHVPADCQPRDAYRGQSVSYHGTCLAMETARGGLGPRVSDYARPSRTMMLDEATDAVREPGGRFCSQPGSVWHGWHESDTASMIDFTRNWDGLTRHNGGLNWLMADGGVRWVDVYSAPTQVSYRSGGFLGKGYE